MVFTIKERRVNKKLNNAKCYLVQRNSQTGKLCNEKELY